MIEHSNFVQIRNLKYGDGDIRRACFVWCPGCAALHKFVIDASQGPVWSWDGDLEKPSFEPSYLIQGGPSNSVCHSYLRNGTWEFLPDSTHSLSGLKIEMVPLPLWLRKTTGS